MENKKKKEFFSAERKSRLIAVLLVAVAFPLILLIGAPFEIYCSNISELTFTVGDFIGLQLLFAFLLALLVFCLLFFLPKVVYEYVYPLFVGLLVMLFLQSNYLNVGLTSLGGDQMGDKISVWTYIWNTALWILVPIGFAVAYRFVKQRNISQLIALVLSVTVLFTQLVNVSVSALTTEGAFEPAIDRAYGQYADKPRFLTNKDIEKVGEDRNVVVFCVDRFDTLLYAEPAMEKYPDAFEFLNDGFTYYNDMLSRYGYTFPSVGYMMSGIEYDHSGDHSDYFNQVYNENSTLSVLQEQGYSIHLYSESYYDYSNANELPTYVENAIETDRSSLKSIVRQPWRFCWAMTKMSLYRTLPFALKGLVSGVSSETCNELILYSSDDLQGYEAYSYDLKASYNYINNHDGNFQTKGKKNFSFIHVSGCHEVDYDENWKKTTQRETKENVLVSAKLSMELISKYIKNMKEVSEDLYRDSTIIILGDHGKVNDRMHDLSDPMVTALFVKPAGVTGSEMKTSSAPVAHENLWATIFESEGIAYDTDFFKPSVFTVEKEYLENGTYPVRTFSWTKRRPGMTSYDLVEYKVNGSAREFSNWTVDARVHYEHTLFTN